MSGAGTSGSVIVGGITTTTAAVAVAGTSTTRTTIPDQVSAQVAQLASTGASTIIFVTIALLMLLAGFLLTRASRTVRTSK
jgi:LPXTG-motif cell wall-anchored protein